MLQIADTMEVVRRRKIVLANFWKTPCRLYSVCFGHCVRRDCLGVVLQSKVPASYALDALALRVVFAERARALSSDAK